MPVLTVALRMKRRGPRCHVKGALIIAPNHSSWIDTVVVAFAAWPRRTTFLMTELFYDLPVIGLYFRLMGARVVRETGPSVQGVRAARDALRAGEVVCLFPEGGFTADGTMGPGLRGVARLARRTGAAVLPLGIRGAAQVYSRLQPKPRLAPVECWRGRVMHFDEEETREGEQRFTDRLMAEIARLAGY